MKLINVPSPQEAKEAYLNALNYGSPGRVPYMDVHIERKNLSRLLGNRVDKLWEQGPLPVNNIPPEWHIEASLILGRGFVFDVHVWDLGRLYSLTSNGEYHYVGGYIKSIDDLKAVPRPPSGPIIERLEHLIVLAHKCGLAAGMAIYGPLTIAQLAMGYEDYLFGLYTDPDLIKAIIDASVDFYMPLIESGLKAGIEFLGIYDIFCVNTGPLFNPDLIRELLFPVFDLFIEPAKAKGVPTWLHSDGNNMVFLDDIINVGFNALHPVEPCDGTFDIYEVQKRVKGRLALAGNIDLSGALTCGKPEDVIKEVREHIVRLAADGGYLCGTSHDVSDSVPYENWQAMVQAIHTYGATYAKTDESTISK